ncbi:MAG: GNAT family N-acetyltransferase [Solirubrobacterales bacterium]
MTPTVRRELRPGDLGAIVAHHGARYSREFGVDPTFEAMVADSVAAAGKRGFPRANERIWIVEAGGRHAGSLALTDEGSGLAMLRWFVLDPELRGRGLGRRLVAELLETAKHAGYERIALETFSNLRAAAHLYLSFGFELVWAQTGPRWGRDEIVYQRYELVMSHVFQDRAQERSSRNAGSSARPFSVRA